MAKAVNAIRGSDKRSVDSLEHPSLQLYCETENLIFNSNSGLQIRTPSSLRQQILSKWIFEERHPLGEF